MGKSMMTVLQPAVGTVSTDGVFVEININLTQPGTPQYQRKESEPDLNAVTKCGSQLLGSLWRDTCGV